MATPTVQSRKRTKHVELTRTVEQHPKTALVQPFDDGDEQPLPEDNFQLSDATSSDDPPSTDDTSSDDSSIMEDLIFMCACDRRAHKADCPLNSRNRYAKRELFPKVTPDQGKTFQLGEYCAIHRARMANKHLICRVTQVFKNRYRLYCTSGILSDNFSSSDMTTCPKKDMTFPWTSGARVA